MFYIHVKCLMVNVLSMTRKNYCFKNPFFAKNAIFSKIMSQSKELFWLIQAPYISKHLSTNGGAPIKASRKTTQDKVFFYFGGKKALSNKSYSPKYVYWYKCFSVWKMVGAKSSVHGWPAQRFRHSIDSHCLCMWVKNQAKTCIFFIFYTPSHRLQKYAPRKIHKAKDQTTMA